MEEVRECSRQVMAIGMSRGRLKPWRHRTRCDPNCGRMLVGFVESTEQRGSEEGQGLWSSMKWIKHVIKS
ncbi:hypothetical protein BT93_A1837 [Corymbia citriodora subsp. variegata]|nr:hypothetical protein BT93_A1837 [Corymbia citriodora subsp. variegata]